jgi:hypothetical protein
MIEPIRLLPAPFLERGNVSVEEELKWKCAELLGEADELAHR